MTSDVETTIPENLIRQTDREKLLAKLESFKIATTKTSLTAREKKELDGVAEKFVKSFIYLCYFYLGLSKDQLDSLELAELQEISEIIYEKTKTKNILLKASFILAFFIPVVGWAYISIMLGESQILNFQKVIEKLKNNYGKDYFPYEIFKSLNQ